MMDNNTNPLPPPMEEAYAPVGDPQSDDVGGYKTQFAKSLRSLLEAHSYPRSSHGAATAFAEALKHKVSASAILKWLAGERVPDAQTLIEISLALNTTIDVLLRGEDALRRAPIDAQGIPDNLVERMEKLEMIDQLIILPKSPSVDPRTGEKKMFAASRSWISSRFAGVMADDLDLMTASGDHMEPTIRAGDDVIYWTAPRFFSDNSIYILRIGHNWMLRRIHQLVTGEFEVICDNNRYPAERLPAGTFPHPLNAASKGHLQVVGKVLTVISLAR